MTSPDPGRAPLTPWQAQRLKRAGGADLAYCAGVLALAALALWSGNAAARHLSPEGAQSVSRVLDELELPPSLPNAVLTRDDDAPTRLWELTTQPRTILAFYAPWCGPCQEELPLLVTGTAKHPERLAVVVGADEDPAEVRKQLDNLGLKDLRFYTDASRQLAAGGRVTALPTTFLLGRVGRVQERIVGKSDIRLQTMVYRATTGEALPFGGEP
jgi:thiol-disulfide isomerase/thioredoxin